MSRQLHHGKHCPYCRRQMNLHDSHLRPTWDHIVPKSRGGKEKIVCCNKCNGIKGDMMPDQWAVYMAANPGWWLLTRAELRARARASREAFRLAKWGPRRAERQGSAPAAPVVVPPPLIWPPAENKQINGASVYYSTGTVIAWFRSRNVHRTLTSFASVPAPFRQSAAWCCKFGHDTHSAVKHGSRWSAP